MARIGGNEFLLLVPGIREPADAAVIASKDPVGVGQLYPYQRDRRARHLNKHLPTDGTDLNSLGLYIGA